MIHDVDPKRSFAPRWPASLNGKYASGTSPAIQPKVPPAAQNLPERCVVVLESTGAESRIYAPDTK